MKSVESAQPHGRKAGYAQAEQCKRPHVEEGESLYTQPKRYRLTEKNLRQHRKEEKALGRSRKTPSSKSQLSTATTTDRQFGPRLIENGVVFDQPDAVAPDDYIEVKTALAKEWDVPASAPRDWRRILRARKTMALSELSLESRIISAILDHHDPASDDYQRFLNDQWTEVENEITTGISDPKPDVTESYLWSAYPSNTREEFEDLVPTQYGYVMPTFAMESKGAGDSDQAEKQAAYDGAVMTHAALAAEGQMRKNDGLYSKTKAITVTLTLKEIGVYANHAVKDALTGKIAYHQYCMERVRYLDSEENWKNACRVVHNAQTFALSLADARIRNLEEYFQLKEDEFRHRKAEQERLQAEARVRASISALSPKQPPKRSPQPKMKKVSAPAADDISVSAVPLAPVSPDQQTRIKNQLDFKQA